MELRALAMEVARVAQDAGRHALTDQLNPHDLSSPKRQDEETRFTSGVDDRLVRFIRNRLTYLDPFDGFWHQRPDVCHPGQRFWCVGNLDGAINYVRNMAEWAVTVSLFEFNEQNSAQPILGVVHAPALGVTYMAARGQGAVREQRTTIGVKRAKIMPSITPSLDGSVVSFGVSYLPEEAGRALRVVASLAGRPADIKRVGPAALDLCRVADGTYDAYFEPHLHKWDVPAISAGTVVVWEAQGHLSQWDGSQIHWRRENNIVATNGLIDTDLQQYLV